MFNLWLALVGDLDWRPLLGKHAHTRREFKEASPLAAANVHWMSRAGMLGSEGQDFYQVLDPNQIEQLVLAIDGNWLRAESSLDEQRNHAAAIANSVHIGETEYGEF